MSLGEQGVLAALLLVLVLVLAVVLASARQIDADRRQGRDAEPSVRLRDVEFDDSDLYR